MALREREAKFYCTYCGARPGERCETWPGLYRNEYYHVARVLLADADFFREHPERRPGYRPPPPKISWRAA